MVAQHANPRAGPAVAASGGLAGPVEHGGNGLVRQQAGERGHQVHHLGIRAPAMLADMVLGHTQWRVITALPANDDVERAVLDAHDDFVDQGADDPLARRR